MPGVARAHRDRLTLVALVHHPLALETGLDPATAAALAASEREALAVTRGVVVTSPATARLLAGYGVAADRITVALPGTDAGPGRQPAPAPRIEQAPVHLLSVASLVPRKGHALLLDALTRLRDLPWQLTCVGSLDLDPPTAQAIRATAHERGLDARITFVGAVPSADLARFYDAADVFVMPTLYEGYGMAVAEAVARGLPVVAIAHRRHSRSRGRALGRARAARRPRPAHHRARPRRSATTPGAAASPPGRAARAATLPTWPETAVAVERALLAAETRWRASALTGSPCASPPTRPPDPSR